MIPGIQGIHPIIGASSTPAGGSGATPTFVAEGGYAASGASPLSVSFPAGLQADDIAFLQVHIQRSLSNTTAIEVPSGWTEVANTNINSAIHAHHALFYKRLTGSESGTQDVSVTAVAGTDTFDAIMSIWRGCVASGTPYEDVNTNEGNSSSMTGADVDTTGANRLVVYFGAHGAQGTCSPAASWTEAYDYQTAQGTPEAAVHTYYIEQATAGTVTGAAHTLSASKFWDVISLALIPA